MKGQHQSTSKAEISLAKSMLKGFSTCYGQTHKTPPFRFLLLPPAVYFPLHDLLPLLG